MIFTDRTVIVQKGTSSINDTIVLYRGDKEVQIRFTLNEGSPFRFGSGASPNIIEKTEAAYGQLIIKRPNDLPAVFSEIAPTNGGKIVFTITAEMIDEITEVGNYTFQIRLFDESMNSRATLPEVVNGIEIREPIATEDITTTNEVGVATVGYAMTTAGTTEDAFDSQGNYNKTTWVTGDIITDAKLNKIEVGIEGVNQKVASGGTGSINDTTASATTTYSSNKIESIKENLSSQINAIANNFTTEQNDSSFIIKYRNKIIAEIPLNVTPSVPTVYGNIIVDATNLEITEGGTSTFTVCLDQAPTNNQNINIISDNSKVTVNPSTLTFTSSNYSTEQIVTVTTEDDNLKENYSSNITLSNNNVEPVIIAVVVKDNEGTSIIIPETPLEVTPLSDFEYTWNTGANRVYLTDYLGTNTTVRIASTYTNESSTLPTYYFKAFNGDTAIENIFYDEGVQLNQSETYAGCTSLKYLNRMLGGNLNRTFDNCTSLEIAPPWINTSDIALYTYNNCISLVNGPDMSASSVTTFNTTFYGCTALKSANIPTTATTLNATFYGCTALKNVTVNSENCEFITSTNAQTFKNTNQEIKIKVPRNSNTLTSLQNYIHSCCNNFGNLNVYDLNDNLITPISLWGDSLTKSPNGGVVNYSTTLLEKVGSKAIIYNFGVAGNTPSQILERQQSYPSRKNDIAIIWMGTNKDWNTVNELINSINTAINYSSSKKYIVIGLVKQHATDEIDNAMANAFGDKFLNIRDYLINNGLTDAGLSATEQDTTDIANKVVPTSLMADNIHLTAAAQVLVGNQVYNKLIALGYLS